MRPHPPFWSPSSLSGRSVGRAAAAAARHVDGRRRTRTAAAARRSCRRAAVARTARRATPVDDGRSHRQRAGSDPTLSRNQPSIVRSTQRIGNITCNRYSSFYLTNEIRVDEQQYSSFNEKNYVANLCFSTRGSCDCHPTIGLSLIVLSPSQIRALAEAAAINEAYTVLKAASEDADTVPLGAEVRPARLGAGSGGLRYRAACMQTRILTRNGWALARE
jgi:hypothetical protein